MRLFTAKQWMGFKKCLSTYCFPRFSLHNKPPDAKKLESARKLRLKQCEMKAIIKEIIAHFLVVCVVLIVAYGNHDDSAFNMSKEVKNVLVDGGLDKISFDVVS